MSPEPVAIIGMSCLFAGAPEVATFRDNVFGAVDVLREAPEGWEPPGRPGRRADLVYTKRGGWLGELAAFDPLSYGVMPTSVDGSEPEHFVALRLAAEALADAGYDQRPFNRAATGVILGRGTFVNRAYVAVIQHTIGIDQTLDALTRLHPDLPDGLIDEIGAQLRAELPPFNAESAPGLAHSVMCGRIANRLDLMGPAYSVDAACASSLIALELATNELESGRADVMLAGGVQVSTTYPIAAVFSELGALSRSGRLRPFHPDADGTLLGEGAGVVVLKRLADAERDGDRVYAVLRGVGSASDGKAMGILAPRVEGEELAIRRAYERAGVDPLDVSLVEAHGTGTPVGDATEIEALRRVWSGSDLRPVTIGSVKSMIGHCIPAAGVASVIKTALALHHRVLPPTLHTEGTAGRFEGTPFRLGERARPWVHQIDRPRRAAVSAFGFGGINAHAVLEEHVASPAPQRTRCGDPSELVVLSAGTPQGLLGEIEEALRLAGAGGDDLPALTESLAVDQPVPGRPRAAVVAGSVADLVDKLGLLRDRLTVDAGRRVNDRRGVYYAPEPLLGPGRLAYVFPGEGAQRPDMLADLCLEFSAARGWFDLLDSAAMDLASPPSSAVFPDPGVLEDARARLSELDLAVLSVYAADRAVLSVLDGFGLRPDLVCGHSSGEFAALDAAGARPATGEEDLVEQMRLAHRINHTLVRDDLVPQARMLAVGAAPAGLVHEVVQSSAGDVLVALDNCPNQVVLSGTDDAITAVAGRLTAAGAVCSLLPIGRAYHTPAFRPVADRLAPFYAGIELCSPVVPLYSCVTAALVPDDPELLRTLARQQWDSPVRFRETVEAMYAAGARVFVEVGPGGLLTGMVRDTLGRREHLAVSVESPGRTAVGGLHHLLAQLVANGADPDLRPLRVPRPAPAARAPRPLDLTLPVLELDPTRLSSGVPASPPPSPVTTPPEQGTSPPAGQPPAPRHQRRRAALLDGFGHTMTRLLDTEQAVVTAALDRRAARLGGRVAAGPPRPSSRVLRRSADAVEVRRWLDPATDDVLRDHTIGPVVSDHTDAQPLAVLPLAVSLELMAETAGLLDDYAGQVSFTTVRARSWVDFRAGAGSVRICVCRRPDQPGWLDAELWQEGSGATDPAVIAGISLGPTDAADTWAPADPGNDRELRWTADELYAPRADHGMFHGPSLQTVTSVDTVSDRGATASLTPDPASSLDRPDLAAPRLVDAAGQVLGYWAADSFRERFVVFPTVVDSLVVRGRGAGPARCVVSVTDQDRDDLVADLAVLGPDVRVSARGWRARRMDLPADFYAFRIDPREHYLSRPLALSGPTGVPLWSALTDVDPAFLGEAGGFWAETLAHLVLGNEERVAWRSLRLPTERRYEWLLGRVAAKDAVRRMLDATGVGRPLPADVQIRNDDLGRPFATMTAHGEQRDVLVSISHSGGAAVAVCAEDARTSGVGIDTERVLAPPEIEVAALTDEERRDLASVTADRRPDLALRAWCAKEAVAKALGTGLGALGGPRALGVADLAHANGVLRVRVGRSPDPHDVQVWSESGRMFALAVVVNDERS